MSQSSAHVEKLSAVGFEDQWSYYFHPILL